jgi:hypothetical protein
VIASLLVVLAAVSAFVARRRRRRQRPAHAVIVSPRKSTVIQRDGAVRSVQSAELTIDEREMEDLWTPPNLENLARTYWRFLSRVTLGLIRVIYDDDSRLVVLLGRPLTLLRFDTPEYTIEDDHGMVRWRIRDGLLVARPGRGCGFLSLDVRRQASDGSGRRRVRIEVEVANFFPSIAAGFSVPVYEMTQSTIHVLVTNAFLRSLSNLDLATSKVGQLAESAESAESAPPAESAPTTERDAPEAPAEPASQP